MRRIVLPLVLAFGLDGCRGNDVRSTGASPEGDSPATGGDDSVAVSALYQQLVATGQRGDADAYAALFLENGAIATPNEPAAAGQAALREWARRFFEHWKVEIDTFAMQEQRIGGTVGYSRYRVTGRYVPKAGGAPVPFDQKYVDTFAKDSTGSWKFGVHMLNSNTSAPGIWD